MCYRGATRSHVRHLGVGTEVAVHPSLIIDAERGVTPTGSAEADVVLIEVAVNNYRGSVGINHLPVVQVVGHGKAVHLASVRVGTADRVPVTSVELQDGAGEGRACGVPTSGERKLYRRFLFPVREVLGDRVTEGGVEAEMEKMICIILFHEEGIP